MSPKTSQRASVSPRATGRGPFVAKTVEKQTEKGVSRKSPSPAKEKDQYDEFEDRDDDFESSDSDDDLTKASVQEIPIAQTEAEEEVKGAEAADKDDYIGIYSDEDSSDIDQFQGDQAYQMYRELIEIVRQNKKTPGETSDTQAETPDELEESTSQPKTRQRWAD